MNEHWILHTAQTTYAVSLAPDRGGLVLDFWGPATDGPVTRWTPENLPPFETAADIAPLEYATDGSRHIHHTEMRIDRGNGWFGARWSATSADLDATAQQSELTVTFTDESGTLQLVQHIRVRSDHDVVQRWIEITNHGSGAVRLDRVFSGGWTVPSRGGLRIRYLAGGWGHEFREHDLELRLGSFSMGSKQGVTGHLFAPALAVAPMAAPPAGAWGVQLAWSGSWRAVVENGPYGDRARLSMGIDDESVTVTLDPGRTFTTPAVLGVFSPEDFAGVARAWHRYQRAALNRSTDAYHHPVVYNSWFATGFDVHAEHQLALADIAAEIGAEVFVLDDGWFTGRKNDTAGLGDWRADEHKFPGGLGAFADALLRRGLRFGIWIEPEMVSPDSDLFRDHPDWIYRAPDRTPLLSRHQFVLDLGRPDVLAWMAETVRGLLRRYPITYLKWDMNRPITDGGRPGDPRGGEWALQHTAGFHSVLRLLREEFPHVTVEVCAGGGARVDAAVLAASDLVWPTDEVGARDLLEIQHGFLQAFPAYTMNSLICGQPGMRRRGASSFGYGFVVAMSGVLGIGADVLRWTREQRAEAQQFISLYRELRPLLQFGAITPHGTPADHPYAREYSDGPGCDGRVCVLVWDTAGQRPSTRPAVAGNQIHHHPRIFPRRLDPDRTYALRGTTIVASGTVLSCQGVEIPWRYAPDADVLIFDPLPDHPAGN
ncbi:alpha-galactosidase [Krasilnikovia cinnamomea]|uniref:alpha-galactosidase n=1 Tax=Krasilnikovia cinnamomea TaxID=349313 RepID=A0A4Q7ZRH2_9ACTN|nr:alpha-galactosidase [Krasilnikovia cinnamomea]RZU53424.1 alpha-galactosidase [Krasilnikovia cinnamomea]